MSRPIARIARLAIAGALARFRGLSPRPDRNPVVAFDGWRARRKAECARDQVQREPEGIQGGARLQGQLSRVDDCRDRGVPRRQCAASAAGVRGRHRDDDGGQGRHRSGRQGDGRREGALQSQGLPAGGRRLLHRQQGQHAVVPVQQLDGRPLHQPGCLQEGRTQSGPGAQDLEGNERRGAATQGRGARNASTRPAGRPGCTSRTSAPGTTCRSAPKRTAWPAWIRCSRSIRRCTCGT